MSTHAEQCQKFCALLLEHPEVSNATVRIGAWLLAVTGKKNTDTLELSYREIRDGLEHDLFKYIAGTGSHIDTVKKSVDWLEKHEVIVTDTGRRIGFGHYARIYKIIL